VAAQRGRRPGSKSLAGGERSGGRQRKSERQARAKGSQGSNERAGKHPQNWVARLRRAGAPRRAAKPRGRAVRAQKIGSTGRKAPANEGYGPEAEGGNARSSTPLVRWPKGWSANSAELGAELSGEAEKLSAGLSTICEDGGWQGEQRRNHWEATLSAVRQPESQIGAKNSRGWKVTWGYLFALSPLQGAPLQGPRLQRARHV